MTASLDERMRAAGLTPLTRRAWLEIDTLALAQNIQVIRSLLSAGVEIAAVVKADGYGHGIEVAARSFIRGGADRLCVAMLDEAVTLREAGVTAPILSLFAIPARDVLEAAELGVELVTSDEATTREQLDTWLASPSRPEAPLRVHLEIDTGLARAGISPERAGSVARQIVRTPGVELAGIWSHLARGDDPIFSGGQAARFEVAIQSLIAEGVPVPPRHLAASAGLFAGTAEPLELVRPGLAAYGELPEQLPIARHAAAAATRLRPAMNLKALPLRIFDIVPGTPVGYDGQWRASRPSRIATLPIGYGDGWLRLSGSRTEALVRGRRVPLVGTVAMDAIAADVTDVPGVGFDDEFVLLGAQGEERIHASDLARTRNTISWEVVTIMARRLPRVYYAGSDLIGVRTLNGEVLP